MNEKQKEIVVRNSVSKDGSLLDTGYSFNFGDHLTKPLDIKRESRFKECLFILISNEHYGVSFKFLDWYYFGKFEISFYDFDTSRVRKYNEITIASYGDLYFPVSFEKGEINIKSKKSELRIFNEGNSRRIVAKIPAFDYYKGFRCDISLERLNNNQLNFVDCFSKNKYFRFSNKIGQLKVHGYMKTGQIYNLNDETYAIYDHSFGSFPSNNSYVSLSFSSKIDDKLVGLFLGNGLGINKNSSENALFIDNEAHKLGKVKIDVPISSKGLDDFMNDWTVRTDDNAIFLTFTPTLHQSTKGKFLIINELTNYVFGRINGYILTENKKIEIKDIPGIAIKSIFRM